MDKLKVNICRIFGIKTPGLQSDSAIKVDRGARKAQSDWFEQLHGNADSVFASQEDAS